MFNSSDLVVDKRNKESGSFCIYKDIQMMGLGKGAWMELGNHFLGDLNRWKVKKENHD